MKRIVADITRLFIPAILVRAVAIVLADIFSAMMAVNLGALVSIAAEQRSLVLSDAVNFGVLLLFVAVVCPVLLFISNKMIFRISIDSEELMFRRVLNQNPTKFEAADAGEVSSKLVDDGIQLRWAVIDLFVGLLDVVLMIAILGWFLINVNFQYTIIILMLVIFGYVKSLGSGSVSARENINILKAGQLVKSKMLEAAASIHFLSINKFTMIFRELLDKEMRDYSEHALKKFRFVQVFLEDLSGFWDALSLLVILLTGAFFAKSSMISIGTVLTMSSYYILLSKQFLHLDRIAQSKKLIKKLLDDISFAIDQPFEPSPCAFSEITVRPFHYQMRGGSIDCADEIRIRKGDKVAITGRNGAGKTTLLHLLIGIRDCEDLTLFIDGTPCDKGHLRWLVSYVDMNAVSLGDTVDHYVLSGKDLHESGWILEEIKQLCDLFPIWDHGMDTLSGGQRKRVDFARSLLENREILALDEPEVGLDAYWKKRIAGIIGSTEQTVLFTTHNKVFASAANVIISVDGRDVTLKSTGV